MDDKLSAKIVQELSNSSAAGLSFEQAKEKLLSEGYTDEQVNLVTDDYKYGSRPTSDIPKDVENYFEKHPDQAVADGTQIAKSVRQEVVQDGRTQAELDILAGAAAPRVDNFDIEGQVNYESKFANDVGIPFWLLMGLVGFINIAAYFLVKLFNVDSWFYFVNGIFTIALIVILIRRIR